MIEADLLMKIRGYDDSEREISWSAIESKIPSKKVFPNSISSMRSALELQKNGVDYFDSLVASLAKETGATVVATDRRIGEIVDIEW